MNQIEKAIREEFKPFSNNTDDPFIKQLVKITGEDVVLSYFKHFVKLRFWKNNRWKKKSILEFYSQLYENEKPIFKQLFKEFFRSNKTNLQFLNILYSYDTKDEIKTPDSDFMKIIDVIAFLKREKQISQSYKALAIALKEGFNPKFAVATIEDKLRLKNSNKTTSIESYFLLKYQFEKNHPK